MKIMIMTDMEGCAGILKVPLDIEEVPVASYLAENPAGRPFMCRRIYDFGRLHAAGLAVPSTPMTGCVCMSKE